MDVVIEGLKVPAVRSVQAFINKNLLPHEEVNDMLHAIFLESKE